MSSFSIENIAGQINIIDVNNLDVNNLVGQTATVTGNLIGVLGGDFDGRLWTLPASGTLKKGFYYGGGSSAPGSHLNLPPISGLKRGDKIVILFNEVLPAGSGNFKFKTDSTFSTTSTIVKPSGTVFGLSVLAASDGAKNTMDIVFAAPNVGPNQGSTIVFVFNGKSWNGTANILARTNSPTANTSDFVTI